MKSQKIRFSLAAALGCVMALQATAAKSEELVLTDSERESYLSSARLYTPVNIPAQNTLVGPTPPKGRSSIDTWKTTSFTVTPPEIVRVSTCSRSASSCPK